MPPKKHQDKTQKSSQKCNFNNRGFCKSKTECKNRHSDVVCDNQKCEEENCDKRHPFQCKYGIHCRFNKKNKCLYAHVTLASDDGKLDALDKAFNKRVNELENSIVSMQNELIGKDSIISGLELRLDELEKKQKNYQQIKDKKIKDLENVIKKKSIQEQSHEDFRCSKCDFVSKTKNGLKTHKARMHTKINVLQYPVECELCEAKLENEQIMKEHLKYHSYKKSTYKCEDCDYCSENFLTMEVHVGKHHGGKTECGLCNFEAKDLEALNMHLSTCQIYVCDECYYRTIHIHEIKEHLEKLHTSPHDSIIHGKVNLKNPEIIDDVLYTKHQLCSST